MIPDLHDQAYESSEGHLTAFGQERMDPIHDVVEYFSEYARENPGAAALWCLGVGFVLGWKLKPW